MEAQISLRDEVTQSNLDPKTSALLVEFAYGNVDKTTFLAELEEVRFALEIGEFKESAHEEDAKFDFYFQNKKAIEKNERLKSVFFKSFHISIPEDFYTQIKAIEGYPDEFYSDELRAHILVEQNYKCGLCQKDISKIHPHLHHINYNKKNCSRENLIFLCPRCHGKTNSQRGFWEDLLVEKKQEIHNEKH